MGPRNECLIAVKIFFAAVIFDNSGVIEQIKLFGTEKYGNVSVSVELAAETWHSFSFRKKSVLFEVKEDPFDPNQAKEFAPWAPSEGDSEADAYYSKLMIQCQ